MYSVEVPVQIAVSGNLLVLVTLIMRPEPAPAAPMDEATIDAHGNRGTQAPIRPSARKHLKSRQEKPANPLPMHAFFGLQHRVRPHNSDKLSKVAT